MERAFSKIKTWNIISMEQSGLSSRSRRNFKGRRPCLMFSYNYTSYFTIVLIVTLFLSFLTSGGGNYKEKVLISNEE